MPLLEDLIATVNRDIINERPDPGEDVVPNVMDLVVASDAQPDREMSMEGNLRVSSLVSLCPRQVILMHRMTDRPPRRYTSATKVAFSVGHGIHNHVSQQVIEAREGLGVWGDWRCRCGHSGRLGFKPTSGHVMPCERCRGMIVNYHEARLIDRVRRIEGHPDLVLGANAKLYLIEVKSMAASAFDNLDSPVHEHLVQALLYRQLMIDLGYGMADEVILFYVRKQWHHSRSPYKEFTADATTGLNRLAVSNCFEVARQIWEALDSGEVPERTLCVSASSPMARECPVAVRCFAT